MTRSVMMSKIGAKDTKPELIVRHGLHRRGYRFSLHSRNLPGRPDLVLRKYRAVILVHGCFWHAHEGCPHFRIPATRTDFWTAKLTRNRNRDREVLGALLEAGWRVLTVWECSIRKMSVDSLIHRITLWLESGANTDHIFPHPSVTERPFPGSQDFVGRNVTYDCT